MVDISKVGFAGQKPEWPQDKNLDTQNQQKQVNETLKFIEHLAEHLAVLAKEAKRSLEK